MYSYVRRRKRPYAMQDNSFSNGVPINPEQQPRRGPLTVPQQPTIPTIPNVPQQPRRRTTPTIPRQPNVPSTPTIPEQPRSFNGPTIPRQPTTPNIPNIPNGFQTGGQINQINNPARPKYPYNVKTPSREEVEIALESIKDSVKGEKHDELFYDYLISAAPNDEEKNIIKSIRDDEIKHNRYFKDIYKDFTGKNIEVDKDATFDKPSDYLTGLKDAIFGELRAVEKYRNIRKVMPTEYYRDILFEIITDELKHSAKYNYLYTKNYK